MTARFMIFLDDGGVITDKRRRAAEFGRLVGDCFVPLLALVLVAVPAGRRFGVDLWLAPRLQAAGQRHWLARIASWFA